MGPSPDYIREFVDSLPPAYRHAFPQTAIEDHARVASRRASRSVHAGTFRSQRRLGWPVCIVADDRPGLLATISAALVMLQLDVVHAEAYTRRTPIGALEAVDVFWLRPSGTKVSPEGAPDGALLEQLERTLERLLDGTLTAQPPPDVGPGQRGEGTVVRFLGGERDELATLEVETSDRSGLLLALARALFAQRVQIIQSEVRTEGERVLDRFTVTELDGTPISSERRLNIQVAVLGALEPSPNQVR